MNKSIIIIFIYLIIIIQLINSINSIDIINDYKLKGSSVMFNDFTSFILNRQQNIL